jgi:hypothetical protein
VTPLAQLKTKPGISARISRTCRAKVKFTGLTQNSQVDPAALELTQILGQPCKFQVPPHQGAEPAGSECSIAQGARGLGRGNRERREM